MLWQNNSFVLVSSVNVLVALLLLTIQCWRRLYETFCVSVFSEARMNITHYVAGFVHYFAAATAIVSEAPYFAVPGEALLGIVLIEAVEIWLKFKFLLKFCCF